MQQPGLAKALTLSPEKRRKVKQAPTLNLAGLDRSGPAEGSKVLSGSKTQNNSQTSESKMNLADLGPGEQQLLVSPSV